MADGGDEGVDPDDAVPEEPSRALEEDEVWAKLVAAYDEEPGPGVTPWPEAESLPSAGGAASRSGDAAGRGPGDGGAEADGDVRGKAGTGQQPDGEPPAPPPPENPRVVHPVFQGPRDYRLADDDDEGHFEPPEPPPLPETDVTTKFAWLAVLGGPLLIFAFILLEQDLPWWAVTVGIGGFLGGFVTLVARMRPGDDEDDDLPGGGAVV